MSLVVDGNEESTRATEDQAKLLTRQTHGGSVDNGHVLLHVLTQQTVKQPLVTVLVRGKKTEKVIECSRCVLYVLFFISGKNKKLRGK